MANRHGLSVRSADLGDADGLVDLLATVGVTLSRAEMALRLDALQGQSGAVFLADEWGPPSGLIALHWHAVLTADLKVAWGSALWVDPKRRRNGIGRVLLKTASQAARAAGCGELLVPSAAGTSDVAAFSLATGFIKAGQLLARPLRKRG